MTPERAARIQALKQHPAWEDFRTEIEEQYDKYVESLGKVMMATGQPFPDFEYKRGYLKGLMEAARMPDQAILAIEKDSAKRTKKQEDEVVE